ncbi:MAG: hypothetical protein P8Y63_06615 [Deltaproteobacteria bacterium]
MKPDWRRDVFIEGDPDVIRRDLAPIIDDLHPIIRQKEAPWPTYRSPLLTLIGEGKGLFPAGSV